MATTKRFTTTLFRPDEPGATTFIELPFDPKEAFGRARAPVRGTINGAPFRSTVAIYDGRAYVGIRRSLREAAKIEAGDPVRVEIALDTEERTVEVPPDLERALDGDAAARAAWDALAYTHRKEHVDAILSAKREETRARRVAAAVALLVEKAGPRAKAAKTTQPASPKRAR